MKLLILAVIGIGMTGWAYGQPPPNSYTKTCSSPSDNVYRDGHCEIYHGCDWGGRKYRGVGKCFRVLVDEPEKTIKDDHRRIVAYCDDTTSKPRNCQKEFDERGEDSNVEDCMNRRLEMHRKYWYEHNCPRNGGFCSGTAEDGIKNAILIDRGLAAKECSPPRETR